MDDTYDPQNQNQNSNQYQSRMDQSGYNTGGQGVGGAYDQLSSGANSGPGMGGEDQMGGGQGLFGSGVAGGGGQAPSNQQQQQQQQGQSQPAEKQDWLDKGIEWASQKAGYNMSDQNADKIGDFMNKEAKQYEGRNIPGVQ
ncbi:hypothetical protein CERSUDRAFT_95573 [Gelatoporia subvermispora B]|uniref:Uncharacterized protein n=1 Tax=Ceriporiopsis subvermispora (strain B) TaxID=914234 RepID=M2PJ47_CERS8|nr:hypothetical protein CERSUDRAFT_95573 [Gelatoporia subvermispora B]